MKKLITLALASSFSFVGMSQEINAGVAGDNTQSEVSRGGEIPADEIVVGKSCPDYSTVITNPLWANGPNKIYSKCPQVFVGISTENPLYNLDVRGDGYFSSRMGVGTAPTNFSRVAIKGTGFGAGLHIIQENLSNYGKLIFMEYDNETTEIMKVVNTSTSNVAFLLQANGKMMINNGSQKIFQLESNGLIRGRQMKLDLDNWADYVFDEDYELMPLSEVEAFVKTEKHLPNIPSEEELTETGLDVEEMNRMLMEKVEELTLYLIEQDKEMKDLKSRISELESAK